MTVRAIRGATTLDVDERAHLHERTIELVESVLSENNLDKDDLISVFFTCTPDIVSDFPAAAARAMGLGDVPLMCSVEMNVDGSLGRVVRLMAHVDVERPRSEITHDYQHGAAVLRRDLAQ